MFYLDNFSINVRRYNMNSTSNDWEEWLLAIIPNAAHADVKHRLCSNLKHIIVGLEMKAGLIMPHGALCAEGKYVLFESYFQIMTFEFCVGVFSVCEGLGSILYLTDNGNDGSNYRQRVAIRDWKPVLVNHFDCEGTHGLEGNVNIVKSTRDKMHQDCLGARGYIDWHAMGYSNAFQPALLTMRQLLRKHSEHVPARSYLLETNAFGVGN